MTCSGSPATGIRLTRSRRIWGRDPRLQRWTHAKPPVIKGEKIRSGKKRLSREKTTPRQKMTTPATIVVVNLAIRKRSARQTAKTAINVGKLATSAVCAKLIHPEEVEVEAMVVRDPEVGATDSNRTRSQPSKQSQSR